MMTKNQCQPPLLEVGEGEEEEEFHSMHSISEERNDTMKHRDGGALCAIAAAVNKTLGIFVFCEKQQAFLLCRDLAGELEKVERAEREIYTVLPTWLCTERAVLYTTRGYNVQRGYNLALQQRRHLSLFLPRQMLHLRDSSPRFFFCLLFLFKHI